MRILIKIFYTIFFVPGLHHSLHVLSNFLLRPLVGSNKCLGWSNPTLLWPQILSLIFHLVNHIFLVVKSCCPADFQLVEISCLFLHVSSIFPPQPLVSLYINIYTLFIVLFFLLDYCFPRFPLIFNSIFPHWFAPLPLESHQQHRISTRNWTRI